MDTDVLQDASSAARRFAQGEVAAMARVPSHDGSPVASMLFRAMQAGLVATDRLPSQAIWGEDSLADGPEASLSQLHEIAIECAGAASCLHIVALTAAESAWVDGPVPAGPGAVAFLDSRWEPTWEAFSEPPPEAPRLVEKGRRYELTGSWSAVDAPPECQLFVVFANRQGRWEGAVAPAERAGVTVEPLGSACGLGALQRIRLTLDGVVLKPAELLPQAEMHRFLRRHMLGLSAIALGNAVGALRAARAYAQDRVQAGKPIEQHGAIELLLGSSGARVSTCAAALAEIARQDRDRPAATWRALATKLQLGQECLTVASDCLRVFGAYGVVDTCPGAKRLRDGLTLNAMGVAPQALRLLCGTTPVGAQQ